MSGFQKGEESRLVIISQRNQNQSMMIVCQKIQNQNVEFVLSGWSLINLEWQAIAAKEGSQLLFWKKIKLEGWDASLPSLLPILGREENGEILGSPDSVQARSWKVRSQHQRTGESLAGHP